MKITITIPDAAIRQAILGAHSRYWAQGLVGNEDGSYALIEHMESFDDPSEWVPHRFGDDEIAKAIVLLSAHPGGGEGSKSFGRLCRGHADGFDGDRLIQYAVFGELKYG
jgi:hypothetical protein